MTSILQTIAIWCVYLLAIVASLAGVLWILHTNVERFVNLTRVGVYFIRYATDSNGRTRARTGVQQDEAVQKEGQNARARADYWHGRMNALMLQMARLMPKNYDLSLGRDLEMLKSDVDDRMRELGLNLDIRQPMENFRADDYRLVEYAYGDFNEKHENGVDIPMNDIERFHKMSIDIDSQGRLLAITQRK